MIITLLGIGAVASGAYAVDLNLSPIGTFYPPNINDTAYITNTSLGTYGGVYNAPANQLGEASPYGVYDYCFMPHPRVQEYQLPQVKGAKLVHLEYIQRHQRRTMYNLAPGGEVS